MFHPAHKAIESLVGLGNNKFGCVGLEDNFYFLLEMLMFVGLSLWQHKSRFFSLCFGQRLSCSILMLPTSTFLFVCLDGI